MRYVGVDYHKKTSYVTALDERGVTARSGEACNKPSPPSCGHPLSKLGEGAGG